VKILISTQWLGGTGGMERSLASIVAALHQHVVHVAPVQIIPSAFSPRGAYLSVLPKWRFISEPRRAALAWWPLVLPFIKRFDADYDLYIQYRNAPYLGTRFRCGTKVLILGGQPDPALEENFDYVLAEAPAGESLAADPAKVKVLMPPTALTSTESAKVEGLPDEYFFTLFNPHGEIKGHDILYEVAEHARCPIVWGHSNKTWDMSREVRPHPNIIDLEDPSQAQIRWLYEHCKAYVSFSRFEGYGWSLADALIHRVPIITRNVGVITHFPASDGIYLYEAQSTLVELLQRTDLQASHVSLEQFEPKHFAQALEALVRQENDKGD